MAPTPTTSPLTPAQRLRWVKVRTMQVFWPACVYASYSEAVRHTHDMAALRNIKPVLDAEDRVVYFFGVGPCGVRSLGSAPNLQLCIAHEEELTQISWTGEQNFERICRQHHVVEDNISRTLKNNCFVRACEEASKYHNTVNDDDEASRLFVSLLVSAKKQSRSSASASKSAVREITMDMTPSKNPSKSVVAVETTPSPQKQTAMCKLAMNKSMVPAMELVAAKCWRHMLEAGWETMTQGNGQTLYKMPGTSFFDFRPNENIFDCVENACIHYLKSCIQSADDLTTKQKQPSELSQFIWPMAEASGWQSIVSANETWYIMPNTPFDKCVPNVTIFGSQTQAVAKFLQMNGLLGDQPEEEATSQVDESMEAAEDSEPELAEQNITISLVDAEESDEEEQGQEQNSQEYEDDVEEEEYEQSSEDENEVEEEEHEQSSEDENEENDEDDEVEEVAIPSPVKENKKPRAKKKAKQSNMPLKTPATTPSSKPTVAPKKSMKRSRSIPAFKCTFGKIENALRDSGWYWKSNVLGWSYFKPDTKGKPISELTPGEDYFVGQLDLEEYLEISGLYEKLRDQLEQEHKRMYESDLSSDSEEEVNKMCVVVEPSLKKSSSSSAISKQPAVVEKVKPEPRASLTRRQRLAEASKHIANSSVKFGAIWQRLSAKGWHYKSSSFEYDYFKPHCKEASEGTPGVDYFLGRDLLIRYLETSGLWEKTAQKILSDDALDLSSSDDDIEEPMNVDADSSSKKAGIKRKAEDFVESRPVLDIQRTPKLKPHCDKKSASTNKRVFQTPSDQTRTSFMPQTVTLQDTEKDGDRISPDAAGAKTGGHQNASVPRKLADIFTPSPGEPKRPRITHEDSLRKQNIPAVVAEAMQKLTTGFTPSSFHHRDDEWNQIRGFLEDCFSKHRGGSMYLSGAPGCGKSALLQTYRKEATQLFEEYAESKSNSLVWAHINAMALTDTKRLFCQLAKQLTNDEFLDADHAFEVIEKATDTSSKRSKTLLLVLDEIDILLKQNGVESELCRLFELAHRDSHSFVFIGIANQVDFTERHLPQLKRRLPDCEPLVTIFKPYTHQTIEKILIDRLGGKEAADTLFNAHGIAFLARKIASTSGDIRLALDTCRRMLHKKFTVDKHAESATSAFSPVCLTEMLRLIKNLLGSKSSAIVQSLPRNHQMILFASTKLAMPKNNSTTANQTTPSQSGGPLTTLYSIDEFYSCYCAASDDAGMLKPLSQREFRGALDILGSEGLLGAAELKKQLVKLLFSPSDVLAGFRNDPFFARLV